MIRRPAPAAKKQLLQDYYLGLVSDDEYVSRLSVIERPSATWNSAITRQPVGSDCSGQQITTLPLLSLSIAELIDEDAGKGVGEALHDFIFTARMWHKGLRQLEPLLTAPSRQLKEEARRKVTVFPPRHQIGEAFNLTPFEKMKVVIIGQDPYHDYNQAHGLCFSVNRGVAIPPSLRNIYKELKIEYNNYKPVNHGNLEEWAAQGVLLLNASLTVVAHKPNSHAPFWAAYTDAVIKLINDEKSNVVFILLGSFAQKKGSVVDRKKHCVLEAAHPSPLSANKFFSCGVFKKANEYLQQTGQTTIDWQISP